MEQVLVVFSAKSSGNVNHKRISIEKIAADYLGIRFSTVTVSFNLPENGNCFKVF